MSKLAYIIICVIFSVVSFTAKADKSVNLTEAEIEAKVLQQDALFEPHYTYDVKTRIASFNRASTKYMGKLIGKKFMYFPVFEEALAEAGLPQDIKYLTVIESALEPSARSHVGAVGLWQFMPGTGREGGLRINKYVDERKDIHKSTKAAIKYLTFLYDKYGDWALAFAAYNSGPGRVNYAIKKAGSSDYWKLKSYLPKETRKYVPYFLASQYLFKNYEAYDVTPEFPDLDLQIIEKTKVYIAWSFSKISEITGIDIKKLRKLNPAYNRDYIPQSEFGYNLVLPKRVIHKFKSFNKGLDQNLEESSAVEYQIEKTVFVPKEKVKIDQVADFFDVNRFQINLWNNLPSENKTLPEGKEVILYLLKNKDGEINWENSNLAPSRPLLTIPPKLEVLDIGLEKEESDLLNYAKFVSLEKVGPKPDLKLIDWRTLLIRPKGVSLKSLRRL
jgi:membrane-bound lytic murein transglycosylase D